MVDVVKCGKCGRFRVASAACAVCAGGVPGLQMKCCNDACRNLVVWGRDAERRNMYCSTACEERVLGSHDAGGPPQCGYLECSDPCAPSKRGSRAYSRFCAGHR